MRYGNSSATAKKPLRLAPGHLALAAILILAAALRFWGIGQKSLWFDEIMTVRNASRPYGDMIRELQTFDMHPPLFQSIQWLWLRLGTGDGFARVPMALAGIAAVWLTWLVARRLLGRAAAWTSAVIMALSYYHIYYSQEARLYALVATLVLAHIYLFLRILHQRGKAGWEWWAVYGFVGLICLYTYVLCIYTIAALALAHLVITWKRRRCQLTRFITVHLVVAFFFLPWLPILQTRTAELRKSLAQYHDAMPRPRPGQIAAGVASWTVGPVAWRAIRPTGAIVGAALLVIAAAGLCMRKARRPAKILSIIFLLPMVAYVAMPTPRVHDYDPKHLIFLQPLLLIAIAGFRLPLPSGRHSGKPALYLAALLAVLNLWLAADYRRPGYAKEQWRAVYHDLRPRMQPAHPDPPRRAGDGVVFSPPRAGIAFAHYSPSPGETEFFQRLANWTWQGAPGVKLRRIWLLEYASPVSRPRKEIPARLAAGGWTPAGDGPDHSRTYPGRVGTILWTLWLPGIKQ